MWVLLHVLIVIENRNQQKYIIITTHPHYGVFGDNSLENYINALLVAYGNYKSDPTAYCLLVNLRIHSNIVIIKLLSPT